MDQSNLKLPEDVGLTLQRLADEAGVAPEDFLRTLLAKTLKRRSRKAKQKVDPKLRSEFEAVWNSQREGFRYLVWAAQ